MKSSGGGPEQVTGTDVIIITAKHAIMRYTRFVSIVMLTALLSRGICLAQFEGLRGDGGFISRSGDTVVGDIMIQTILDFYVLKIRCKDQNGRKYVLAAEDLKGFWFRDNSRPDSPPNSYAVYESHPKPGNPEKMVLMKLSVEGNRIRLFEGQQMTVTETNFKDWWIDFHPSYSLVKGKIVFDDNFVSLKFAKETYNLPMSFVILKNGLPLAVIRKGNFDDLFNEYFGDLPQLVQYLVDNPDVKNFRNLTFLVAYYNSL